MTVTALPEELKEVDPKLYDDISHLELIGWQQPRNQAMDHLQGSIQRACERREWIWHHGHGPEMGYVATVNHGNITKGDTAAEALLAAYIAAVREEAK